MGSEKIIDEEIKAFLHTKDFTEAIALCSFFEDELKTTVWAHCSFPSTHLLIPGPYP